jgi:anti-sigma regulatory factor (Ser/Thr protein kinase)
VKDKQANYRATTPSALRGEAIDSPHRSAVRPEAMIRVFGGRDNQVACARAFVRTALGPVSVVDEAVLLVSELCTNALLHTASGYDGTFEVAVYLGPLSVRIEVRDGGAAQAPSVRQPVGTFAEYGRGLDLVELLSDRWGYSGDSNGRSVFFELRWKQPD